MNTRAFTLIEMLVAVGLFAVVMLVSITSLLALVDANRKARALETIMSNLNIGLDGMIRSIRTGTHYRCDSVMPPDTTTDEGDCTGGGTLISFLPVNATLPIDQSDRWVFRLNGTRLEKSENGGSTYIPLTPSEITIDYFRIYVVGTRVGSGGSLDYIQPKVVVAIKGTAGGTNLKTRTTFSIQTTASRRVLDI